MAAQSVASRSRKVNPSGSDDVVLARAIQLSNWARANIRIIVAGAVLTALVVGGLLYWRVMQEDRRERAAAAFMQVEATVSSGNVALAARDLEGFIASYGGTDYATEARLLLARVRLQEGQPAQAVEVLAAVDAGAGEGVLGTQAALLRAAAQQAAGQTEQAVQTYLSVAEQAELPYQRQEALQAAAMLRAQAGDHAGAAELYGRLVESTEEGSVERSLYQMRLAEAEAQAAAPR